MFKMYTVEIFYIIYNIIYIILYIIYFFTKTGLIIFKRNISYFGNERDILCNTYFGSSVQFIEVKG